MSGLDQNAKYSLRANVFCFATNNRHRSIASAGPFGAITGLLHRSNCVLFDHLAGRLTSSAGNADGYFPRACCRTRSARQVSWPQHRFQWSASAPARIKASWLPGNCRPSPSRAARRRAPAHRRRKNIEGTPARISAANLAARSSLRPDVTADIALRNPLPLCRQGKKPETDYREVVGNYLNRLANRL
jgi:hypothetical protein